MTTATTSQVRTTHAPITAMAILVLTVAACAGPTGPGADTSNAPHDPAQLDGSWELVEGTGPDGDVDPVDDHPVTLEIDGDDWAGTAACNSYGATVTLADGTVQTDGFFATEMACPTDGVMESEAAYLAALGEVSRWSLDDAELRLAGPDTELVFQRRDDG